MLEYSRFDPDVLFAIRPAVVPGFSLRPKRNDAWVASGRGLLARPLVHLHLAFREKPLDGQFDSARHRSLAVGEGRDCSPRHSQRLGGGWSRQAQLKDHFLAREVQLIG